MAFEARPKEMLEAFQKFLGTLTVEESKEIEPVKAAIVEYGRRRERALTACFDVFSHTEPGDDAGDKWARAVSEARASVSALDEGLRDLKAAARPAGDFVKTLKEEESAFYACLDKVRPAAEAAETLCSQALLIAEKANALDAKWEKLTEGTNSFHEKEKGIVDEIQRLMADAAGEAARKNASLKEKVALVLTFAQKTNDFASSGGPTDVFGPEFNHTLSLLGQLAEYWTGCRNNLSMRFEEYLSILRFDRSTILPMFGDFHKDAEEFVKRYGLDKADEALERAKKALSEASSSLKTRDQTGDFIGGLSTPILSVLQRDYDRARNAWEDFVKRHQYRFFGPIAPQFIQHFTKIEEFQNSFRSVVEVNLHEMLTGWLNDSRAYWSIDVAEGLSDESKKSLKSLFADAIDRVVKAEEEMARIVESDNIKQKLLAEREAEKSDLEH